ncbi:hypothetical protein HMPREF9134_00094 [Porphyromonas catoniae F0037]|uniref:Uncharacterized protein n=1 Tax=Porphyromonas catoniae F0037 TaxID=1127696 RepID=L1NIV9_9PORP|nr:hypothetical protein HMPREF9134_00094 [Porphyromonas catoniae F0037]
MDEEEEAYKYVWAGSLCIIEVLRGIYLRLAMWVPCLKMRFSR